jgi:integrase
LLNANFLDFIERDLIVCAIVKLGRAGTLVGNRGLGVFKQAAVVEIGGNARGAEGVISYHSLRWLAGHAADTAGPVFRPVTNNRTGDLDRALDPASVYQNNVRKYGLETGISAEVNGLRVHSLRATAATNALSHEADIAKVQEWLGHANVSTTRLYDRRKTRPDDSPTFRVRYQT